MLSFAFNASARVLRKYYAAGVHYRCPARLSALICSSASRALTLISAHPSASQGAVMIDFDCFQAAGERTENQSAHSARSVVALIGCRNCASGVVPPRFPLLPFSKAIVFALFSGHFEAVLKIFNAREKPAKTCQNLTSWVAVSEGQAFDFLC